MKLTAVLSSRPDLALVWAFFSTLSSAGSTLLYLVLMHDQPWAPEFIQLYSTMGMISGWLNALIYFFAPRSVLFQTRRAALFFFVFAIAITSGLYVLIFQQNVTGGKLLFLAANFTHVLYANAFGIEFYEGNYPWAYRRVITLNIGLLLAGAGAFLFTESESGLYLLSGLVGACFFLLWLVDRWNRIDDPRRRPLSIRPWLNPSLPVLERTLWDQSILARLGALDWSFWIYALGRVITFSGNVAYSYLMGTSSTAFTSTMKRTNRLLWFVVGVAVPLALAAPKYYWSAFLLSQIFAWLMAAQLTSRYHEDSRNYGLCLLVWFGDLALRGVALAHSQRLGDYVPLLTISSVIGIAAILLLALRKPATPLPGIARTKSRPADFPDIR